MKTVKAAHSTATADGCARGRAAVTRDVHREASGA